MITNVHVKNFRSLKEISLKLGRNNILVGPNMSGKSNFLDIFKFLQDLVVPGSMPGLNNAFNARNGFQNVVWRGAENPVIFFQLQGKTDSPPDFDWTYELSIIGNSWGGAQVLDESLVLKDLERSYSLIETKDQKRCIYSQEATQISEVVDWSRLAIEYEWPSWTGNFIRRFMISWRFYSFLPPLMRTPNATTATNSLALHGENLSAWLMLMQTRYFESFELLRNTAKDVFPSMQSLFTTPTAQTTVYLASSEKHLGKPITVAEMSDGELAFLAVLSLLYSPADLAGGIYFVEELENYLHPRLISVLAELLKQTQEESDARKRQFVVTTHSPYVVDKFALEELILFNKKEGATQAERPKDQQQLKELIADEQIGLGELYFSGALSGA